MPSVMYRSVFHIFGTIACASVISVPLTGTSGPGSSTLTRRALPIAQMAEDQFFWFGNYSVGSGESFELLVDTGSSDIFINPGKYKPGLTSKNRNRNFTASFSTAKLDGTGFITVEGSWFQDSVSLYGSNFTVPNQDIGICRPGTEGIPRDGLIGFAGIESSFGGLPGWFENLCTEKAVPECRYGLAFNTNKTGVQYLGGVENSVFKGDLVTTPLEVQWVTWGDVAVNGEIIARDTRMLTDMGTAVIWGPIDTVQEMYKRAGIEWEIIPPTNTFPGKIIQGSYPCASPPTFGFGFPSTQNITDAAQNATSGVSRKGSIFNVVPEALIASESDGKCKSILKGVTNLDIWIIGQPFYQGRYIDHNFETRLMGWADLE
ncbi:acid protease [Periconia macrospinosa]|uniref:Acid protease n=1 Tax=Periconia macrospinosa TaxID=97972 RepID=A0A2V1EET4_9PLEO|nr:acid protease [Periconia macrospinosa]